MVTPQWLRDCVKQQKPLPCEAYAAIRELRTETAKNCPDCNLASCACSDSDTEAEGPSSTGKHWQTTAHPQSSSPAHPLEMSERPISHLPLSKDEQPTKPPAHVGVPANLLPPDSPIPTRLDKLNYASRYACQRASPLICPNQELVRELNIMQRSRAMEGEERSALSYERAISVVKGWSERRRVDGFAEWWSVHLAYPHRITSIAQVQKLPFIGQKIGTMVSTSLHVSIGVG